MAYDAAGLHCMAQATAQHKHKACKLIRPSSARLQALSYQQQTASQRASGVARSTRGRLVLMKQDMIGRPVASDGLCKLSVLCLRKIS